jgi:hypothetical protein
MLLVQGNEFPDQSDDPPVDPRSPDICCTCEHHAAETHLPARRRLRRSRSRSGPATLTGSPATSRENIHSVLSETVTNVSPRPYNTRDAGQSGATLSFGSDKTLSESSNPVRRRYVVYNISARASAHYRYVGPLVIKMALILVVQVAPLSSLMICIQVCRAAMTNNVLIEHGRPEPC